MSEPKDASATATLPAPGPRTVAEIEDALAAARAEHAQMQREVHAYVKARDAAKIRVERLRTAWVNANGVDLPFEPNAFPIPAVIPPESTPLTVKYHAIHSVIATLEAELHAAKRRANGLA